MYMYLSDRIRRMFLSGACPQNISPKKPLSLKDQRFLQKTKDDNSLSRILLKQQKLLYEKHIGLLLQEKKANINKKKTNSFFLEKTKNKGDTYFSQNSEGLFVLNIKVQKEKREGLFDIEEKKKPTNKAIKTLVLLEKNRILDIDKRSNEVKQKSGDTPSIVHYDSAFVSNACERAPAKRLFVNNEKSKSFRYLYDHESLKTSIVPQIFKNQKPISRAKTLLHERKKIALLYGQLAKKDIIKISRKALSIPGFFEDNMFTLLESRVDVCVFRAGFSKTIAGARQLIRNGSVLVNGQKIYSCKRKAKPGDYFSFTNKQELLNPYRSSTLELYHLYLSSNLLKEWVSLNKIRFLLELTFKDQQPLTETKKKKTLFSVPGWLLLLFFGLPSQKKYKPNFCSSLYWGFFFYKLKKMPVFSCFFEQKKKGNKRFNAFEKEINSIAQTPLNHGHNLEALNFCHKGQQPVQSLFVRKLAKGILQKISRTPLEKKQKTKGVITAQCFAFEKEEKNTKRKSYGNSCSAFIKKKSVIFLNLYTQLLLKKQQQKIAQMYLCSNKGSSVTTLKGQPKEEHLLLHRKIPSSNLWAIWGQKPLHLEISQKTGGFIYMYKPQKMISPVCLDFKP